MRVLFDYLEEKEGRSIKTAISVFISKHDMWSGSDGLPDKKNVNKYNRVDLAEQFIKKKGLYNGYSPMLDVSEDRAKLDIVEYIDLVIPRYYYIKREKMNPKNKKKSAEKIRNSYQGIEEVEGLVFSIKENYDREKEYISDRDATIPANAKEFNDLNFPYKRFSDEELMDMLYRNCCEKGVMLLPEKQGVLKRTEILKLLHYLYKGREFKSVDNYLISTDAYKEKYDKSLEYCFIDSDIQLGDFVTYIDYSTEMEILGGYYGVDFVQIGQVYNRDEKNNEWKVNWIDMGIGEWEYAGSLRVLNPNIEPIRTVCENMFREDVYDNPYYESIDRFIEVAGYSLERKSGYFYSSDKIYNANGTIARFKLEKDLRGHRIYSYKNLDKTRDYYLVDVSNDNSPIYYIDNDEGYSFKRVFSKIVEEIRYVNRTDAEKLYEQEEIERRNELIKFFYDEDYDAFARRGYPTLKQLYFIGDLLNISYNSVKNVEDIKWKESFYKCNSNGKFYLKPKSTFKNLEGFWDVATFINDLKIIAYAGIVPKIKFLDMYFEIKR